MSQCQHIVADEQRPHKGEGVLLKSKECTGVALKNGWCRDHQHSAELLLVGERLGFPEIAAQGFHLSAGRFAWESYAECFPRTVTVWKNGMPHILNRYEQVMGILDAMLSDAPSGDAFLGPQMTKDVRLPMSG